MGSGCESMAQCHGGEFVLVPLSNADWPSRVACITHNPDAATNSTDASSAVLMHYNAATMTAWQAVSTSSKGSVVSW